MKIGIAQLKPLKGNISANIELKNLKTPYNKKIGNRRDTLLVSAEVQNSTRTSSDKNSAAVWQRCFTKQ